MKEPELLPEQLAQKSLSDIEIVLSYDDAIRAIQYLSTIGYFVFAWEGWVKNPDGKHGHSLYQQGTTGGWEKRNQSAKEDINKTATFVQQTMKESQQKWDDNPEIEGATLYFCLSIEAIW